jgi:hypothetical protein
VYPLAERRREKQRKTCIEVDGWCRIGLEECRRNKTENRSLDRIKWAYVMRITGVRFIVL